MSTQPSPEINKHLHTLQRVINRSLTHKPLTKSSREYYRCVHPDCAFTTPKELLFGKRAECFICHRPFIVTPELAQRAKIHCVECIGKGKKSMRGCFGYKGSARGEAKQLLSREELIKLLQGDKK